MFKAILFGEFQTRLPLAFRAEQNGWRNASNIQLECRQRYVLLVSRRRASSNGPCRPGPTLDIAANDMLLPSPGPIIVDAGASGFRPLGRPSTFVRLMYTALEGVGSVAVNGDDILSFQRHWMTMCCTSQRCLPGSGRRAGGGES